MPLTNAPVLSCMSNYLVRSYHFYARVRSGVLPSCDDGRPGRREPEMVLHEDSGVIFRPEYCFCHHSLATRDARRNALLASRHRRIWRAAVEKVRIRGAPGLTKHKS